MSVSAQQFEGELFQVFASEEEAGRSFVDVTSGHLHRQTGGYPGANHRMPVCCEVMYRTMKAGDQVLSAPPKGKGASVTIRYGLPRR